MEENKKDVLPLEGEPLTAPQISEPVVNALAAALSKIETYVPTQYIDDGPPDIDADHLNHAEQAIMRVTNLANGAADAIAALQSQVTQLNNNFQLVDNATRFVAGSSEKSKAYLRTFDVSGRLFQLALSESGLLFSGYNGDYGSSGKTLWEGVTKSDLTNNLNHKKQILPWGNYRDGSHSISNLKFGSNLYIAVGTSAKVQKRCSIISANDIIEIPHREGFITIVFNDTNHITVSGTTDNYQLREIRASDLLGV